MRIKELLKEYNEERLINDFGGKLLSRIDKDSTAPKTDNMTSVIQKISSIDPSPNKELAFWCVLNYANANNPKFLGGITKFEDIGRAMNALEIFKKLLMKPKLSPPLPVRDINQIRGLVQLEKIVDSYSKEDTVSNKEQANSEEAAFYKTNQAKLLYNDNQIKVIIPKTEQTSCFFGKGTKWCTAATKNNMFSNYSKADDPLYIVMIKGSNEKYQFHFGTDQFMDATDLEINPVELFNKYPILWKIFEPIAIKNLYLPLIKNPSESVQLAAVQKDGYSIRFIKNPSEDIKLAAVHRYGYAINYIKNPSESVQLAAVQQNGYSIQHIENPSEAIQLAAVKQNGYSIQIIKNPSEAVQLAAVHQFGYAIHYIKNPSEDIQLAAVQQNRYSILYIKNPSEAVQLAAKSIK
jgi:hypothetical protein